MALTKTNTTILASTSNAAAGTTNTSALTIGYGSSVIATVTNGATGPTVGCDIVHQVSADGTTWYERERVTCPTTASGVYTVHFASAIGAGGDWTYERLQFTGNTGQAVTTAAFASQTSGL